eukprot:2183626-Pyramimonas_sp.AAC.1
MSRARGLSCTPRGSRVAANRRFGLSEGGHPRRVAADGPCQEAPGCKSTLSSRVRLRARSHSSRDAANRRSGSSEDGASTGGGGRRPLADSPGMQEYLELPREASCPQSLDTPRASRVAANRR